MKALLFGDIGWEDLYHLGDEAMLEAAVEALSARGVSCTVVAGSPAAATELYGIPAVKRVRYPARESLSEHNVRLEQLDTLLKGDPAASEGGVFEAVRDADFVVISGGGNLNDMYRGQVYERLSLARIAARYQKPLVVVSQTIGPSLSGELREMVREIVDYAVLFGCRDEPSAYLVRSIATDRKKVFRCFDDASMIEPSPAESAHAHELLADSGALGEFVIGSFSASAGNGMLSKDDYRRQTVLTCEALVDRGLPVLLVPHMGSLDPATIKDDQLSDSEIARSARGGGVTAMPMMRAGVVAELTKLATLSVSTRYHPSVFSMAKQSPYLGLIDSNYSSVRLRGALGNFGMQAFGVPHISSHALTGPIDSLLSHSEEIRELLSGRSVVALQHIHEVWDAVVASVAASRVVPPRMPTFSRFTVGEEWSRVAEAQLPLFNELSKARAT